MATVLDLTVRKKTGKGKAKGKPAATGKPKVKPAKKITEQKKPVAKGGSSKKKSDSLGRPKNTGSKKPSGSGNLIRKTTGAASGMDSGKGKTGSAYRRRKIGHIWPPIGTIIIGRLRKQTFRAEIVDDPDLHKDHGRAIRSLDDQKLPLAYSFNTAAQSFTKALRDKHKMKPIANGWKWWRRENDNKRLFDIPEYSQITDE
ncbi:MAG: hypothetical protein JXR97_12135 [Planctomycetes bacterium]|nr:hypothetical protein [Planctomycetota bacterium]